MTIILSNVFQKWIDDHTPARKNTTNPNVFSPLRENFELCCCVGLTYNSLGESLNWPAKTQTKTTMFWNKARWNLGIPQRHYFVNRLHFRYNLEFFFAQDDHTLAHEVLAARHKCDAESLEQWKQKLSQLKSHMDFIVGYTMHIYVTLFHVTTNLELTIWTWFI